MNEKLPDGWEWKKLEDIGEVIAGVTYKSEEAIDELAENYIPILRANNINNEINFENLVYVPASRVKAKQLIQENDILIAMSSGSKNIVGKAAQSKKDFFGSFGAFCGLFRCKEGINKKYVGFYFKTPSYRNIISNSSRGANINNLRKDNIKSLDIPLPPLDVQQKIVSILEKAEETKRLRAQADELTQQLLKSVFLEMFGDPVRNEKGWELRKLREFGTIKTGNTPSRKVPEYYGNFIEWIKSDNINTPYTFLTESEEMLSEEGAKIGRIAPPGSILVTCIAGSLSCIGNASIANRKVAFNQQINAITPNERTNTFFLYHLILYTKKYIQDFSTQSMKGMLSKGSFESIPFILPPIELQNRFGTIAEHIEKTCERQIQSSQQLHILFDSLMQKAFTGELVS